MSLGVPAGAMMANQELNSKPGTPDSDTVGTSGNCGRRFGVVTPTRRSLPAATSEAVVAMPWNAAFTSGIADTNPYNGITPGMLNLWATDSYHASKYGYYLHALVVFGMETGRDPRILGGQESAAVELGFTASEAFALQSLAYNTITAVPEPGTWGLMALGAGVIGFIARRRKSVSAL